MKCLLYVCLIALLAVAIVHVVERPANASQESAPAMQQGVSVKMAGTSNAQPMPAADNADALLILTDWAEFTGLDLEKLRYTLRYPIIIDGRNLFDPWVMQDLGFTYLSVGRPSQHTSVESASTKRWP